MTLSIAEEAESATSVDNDRAHSDRRSGENEYGDSVPTTEGRVGATQPICDGDRQEEELLYL